MALLICTANQTELPPLLSGDSPSCNDFRQPWWEAACCQVINTTSDVDDIKLITRFCPSSTRNLNNLRRNLPSTPTWDTNLILSGTYTEVANNIIFKIYTTFCKFSFDTLTRYVLGYDEPTVSEFYINVSVLWDDFFKRFEETAKKVVEEALQSQNPSAYSFIKIAWSSNPLLTLQFLRNAIERVFSCRDQDIIPMLKRLSILSIRYDDKITIAKAVDWQNPIRTDFIVIDGIDTYAVGFGDLLAAADQKLFDGLQHQSATYVEHIYTKWEELSHDVKDCITVDWKSSTIFSSIALSLLSLGNFHSGTAILSGLRASNVYPEELYKYWPLLDPADNYLAYRQMLEQGSVLIRFVLPDMKKTPSNEGMLKGGRLGVLSKADSFSNGTTISMYNSLECSPHSTQEPHLNVRTNIVRKRKSSQDLGAVQNPSIRVKVGAAAWTVRKSDIPLALCGPSNIITLHPNSMEHVGDSSPGTIQPSQLSQQDDPDLSNLRTGGREAKSIAHATIHTPYVVEHCDKISVDSKDEEVDDPEVVRVIEKIRMRRIGLTRLVDVRKNTNTDETQRALNQLIDAIPTLEKHFSSVKNRGPHENFDSRSFNAFFELNQLILKFIHTPGIPDDVITELEKLERICTVASNEHLSQGHFNKEELHMQIETIRKISNSRF